MKILEFKTMAKKFLATMCFLLFAVLVTSAQNTRPIPENVAMGKSARQSSTGFGGDASRAVDGNTSGQWRAGSVTHTADERSAWWEVDLGEVYELDRIVIWNREDCCWDRLQNFIVHTSVTPFVKRSENVTFGDGFLKGPFSPWEAGKRSFTIEVDETIPEKKARYVKIILRQGAADRPLSLAEVQVFGTPIQDNITEQTPEEKPTSVEYVVEMLGRQGKISFEKPLSAQPTSAKLTLYKGDPSQGTDYQIVNGTWENGTFSADVMNGADASVKADLPGVNVNGIKLRPTKGSLAMVGAICYQNFNSWVVGSHLVLAYDLDREIIAKGKGKSLFALTINDKHAGRKWDREKQQHLDTYSYGWWMEPEVAVADNFRMVHLVKDDLLNEVALYAFDNSNGSDRKANLTSFKVAAYPLEEIMDGLKLIYPEHLPKRDIIADLASLLINRAQLKFPSKYLGFKSSGHGTPTGIMNGFFDEPYHITAALGWAKEIKGGNIDFLDFSTNCNVASLYNLNYSAPYVDYVVASDLTRSSPLPFKFYGERPDTRGNYATYFADESKDVPAILGAIVDKYGELFNSSDAVTWAASDEATKNGRTLTSWRQQLTLFDMSKMRKILEKIGGEDPYETCRAKIKEKESSLTGTVYEDHNSKYYAFKTAVPILFPNYTSFASDWDAVTIKQMSNRKQFQWEGSEVPTGLILSRKY